MSGIENDGGTRNGARVHVRDSGKFARRESKGKMSDRGADGAAVVLGGDKRKGDVD